MNIYETPTLASRLSGNPYPGRGIAVGCTADGRRAAIAYFIMGRSENSRNRVFALRDGDLYTEPFDPSKVKDPSLIIYAAVRSADHCLVVTNGDQTDTICEHLTSGGCFHSALVTRAFEPDAPNFTPRISAIVRFDGGFSYEMAILKSADETGSACQRQFFEYPAIGGVGHFLHTYVTDGSPIPSFQGEPERVSVPDDIDEWTDSIWNALDPDNRISLYVRFTDSETGDYEDRLINRNH